MPCYDPRTKDIPELLNKATKAACEMAKIVDLSKLSYETLVWIDEHESLDASLI